MHLSSKTFRNRFIYPSKGLVNQFIEGIFNFLFISNNNLEANQDIANSEDLKKQFWEIITPEIQFKQEISFTPTQFWDTLPELKKACLKDAQAILEFDPAAENIEEVLYVYPGFFAIAQYRIAQLLWKNKLKITARLFSEYTHSKTGIDIHPGAQIGESFAIDHGTGIVIGETTIIGDHVKLYQGVTLGALQVSKDLKSTKRHPTIENNVVIYANATILGGNTVIGSNCVIGGNVWITKSIETNSLVYHKSEIIIRGKEELNEPIHFII